MRAIICITRRIGRSPGDDLLASYKVEYSISFGSNDACWLPTRRGPLGVRPISPPLEQWRIKGAANCGILSLLLATDRTSGNWTLKRMGSCISFLLPFLHSSSSKVVTFRGLGQLSSASNSVYARPLLSSPSQADNNNNNNHDHPQ